MLNAKEKVLNRYEFIEDGRLVIGFRIAHRTIYIRQREPIDAVLSLFEYRESKRNAVPKCPAK